MAGDKASNFFIFGCSFWLCGVLVPWPGIELWATAVEAQSFNHWTGREALKAGNFKWKR